MKHEHVIDSAMGGLFEAIGEVLTKNRREDASGARRAIADRFASGDYRTAGVLLGIGEDDAMALHARFKVASAQ